MAHGRKQKCDLTLVMFDIGDLLDHLDHQHHIAFRIKIREARKTF